MSELLYLDAFSSWPSAIVVGLMLAACIGRWPVASIVTVLLVGLVWPVWPFADALFIPAGLAVAAVAESKCRQLGRRKALTAGGGA